MPDDQTSYAAFRHRLDDVLREKDPGALRTFLVAEGQWEEDAVIDSESAMWMMIAASKALAPMHMEARHWLLTHGHEAEAQAIFGARAGGSRSDRPSTGAGPARPQGGARRPRRPKADTAARREERPTQRGGITRQGESSNR